MSWTKWLLMTIMMTSGVYAWHQHRHSVVTDSSGDDHHGFVAIAPSADAPTDRVVILAPRNCPSAQAKRADVMAEQLGQLGIPTTRLDHYSVHNLPLSEPLMSRTKSVLGGRIPIVIINGMAKTDPKVSEVAAEYRRSR